jgi:hypothetical protein
MTSMVRSFVNKVLLQFIWRRGFEGQRIQGFQVLVFVPYPSAIFEGIEKADLLIFEIRRYISSFGNLAAIL